MQPTTMMPEITDDMLNVDDDTSDDETSQEKENVSEKRDFDHVTSFIEQEIAKMTAKNPGLEKKLDMAKTRKMPDISLPEDLDSEEDDSKLKETKHIKELTSEQKSYIFIFHTGKGYRRIRSARHIMQCLIIQQERKRIHRQPHYTGRAGLRKDNACYKLYKGITKRW